MELQQILILAIYSLVWFVAGMISMMIIYNRRAKKKEYEELLDKEEY